MVFYNYTKETVYMDTLTVEILNSDISSAEYQYTSFTAPNYLKIFFDDDLTPADKDILDDVVANHSTSLTQQEFTQIDGDVSHYVSTEAIVEDSYTSMSGSYIPMQVLIHSRELYNASDNPLYIEGFTPILGEDGILQNQADDINNIITALGKNGWYTQYIKNWTYPSPFDLLIYYGWLNSFNYGTNAWNNENVAQDMAKYNYLIFGDGVQDSGHGDYTNTQIIIPRIKVLNQRALIFGYVTADQSLVDFKSKVDDWNTLDVDGIFMDECGYDYGRTRAEFNERVDYVHGKTNANLCFVNAWNLNHILGTDNDPSYPNSTYNTTSGTSNLTENDWCLLESFPINTTAFTTTGGYESKSDWAVRGADAVNKRYTYGINLAACGIINNDNVNGQNLFNFGFVSAMMWNLEVFGSSDTGYGASSATVKHWDRPKTEGLGREWAISPSIQLDLNDADKYHRYLDFGQLTLDFSTSAQTADIEKFTPPDSFKIRFNAGDLTEGVTNYPLKTTASGNPITGLGFDDTTEESMYDAFEIPTNWKHGTDGRVKVYFFNDYSQTGTKVCRWALDYQIYADLENAASKTTTTLTVDKSLPADVAADTFIYAEMTMPHNDSNNPLKRNSMITFRIYRDATNAADTMTNDAILVLLVFEFDTEVI